MAKLEIKAGTTSKLIRIFVQDSSVTTGAGLTGLTNASSGLTAYYIREGAASATVISLVSATLGTFTSSGFIVVDGTNLPGCYELGIPDAAIAAGAKSVLVMLKGATNMAPVVLEIELTAVDNQDAVRYGMTALPNAAAEASGGLYTRGTGAGQIKQTNNGEIDANATHINNVATTSVTVVAANQGTTQPVNFTGTGASALAKADTVDIAGAAVSTTTAQIGANVVQMGGVANEATLGLHSPILRGGTAQATGNTTSAIKLDSGASATNDAYKGSIIRIISGTAAGSFGVVNSYVGSTKIATISGTWQTGTPDNTSVFVVLDYGLGRVWDELVTGAIHNANNSAATFLRNAGGGGAISIRAGTAQTGSTSTTIKLDSGASATNNIYNGMTVVITGGTGLGQTRTIIAYNGTTKVATVAGAWVTTPDNTSTFALYAAPTSLVSDQGVAQAGAASTLTLAATASAITSIYVGSFLTITGGTDAGDTSVITAYNGTTKVATVSPAWAVTPDSSSTYAVIPSGAVAPSSPTPPSAADIAASILLNPANLLYTDSSGQVRTTSPITKNTALANFPIQMVLASDHISPATGKTVTVQRAIDNGAYANCASPTATENPGGDGTYAVNLAAADLNGTTIQIRATASGCDPFITTLVPQT